MVLHSLVGLFSLGACAQCNALRPAYLLSYLSSSTFLLYSFILTASSYVPAGEAVLLFVYVYGLHSMCVCVGWWVVESRPLGLFLRCYWVVFIGEVWVSTTSLLFPSFFHSEWRKTITEKKGVASRHSLWGPGIGRSNWERKKEREPYPGDGHVRRFSFYHFLYYVDVFSFPSLRGIQGIWWYRFFFFSAAFDMSRDGMR